MANIRNTQQKMLIRDLLYENYTHPTADEVYQIARGVSPNISRGTVYRILNQMADNGEVTRLSMPMGADHYDINTHNHYHFICRKCKKVMDTGIPYDEKFNMESKGMNGCKTEWHRLVLVGLCEECNQQ